MEYKGWSPMKKIFYNNMVCLCVLFGFLHIINMDDGILSSARSAAYQQKNISGDFRLNDYTLVSSQNITCLDMNLSGITFSRRSKTLFAVLRSPIIRQRYMKLTKTVFVSGKFL
jgi:uncharacterized protein YjiK